MLVGPSQMNQNNPLVDSSKLLASSIEQAEEEEVEEEAEEAAEEVVEAAGEETILTTTPTPLPPKPQTENLTGRNQPYSQEIER